MIILHYKRNRLFVEPLKEVPKMSNSVKKLSKSQKNDEKVYETLKGSDDGHRD